MTPPLPGPTRPLILGLTGSIGMGKSAVAAMVIAMGIPVFDADAEVHALQGPQGALVAAIEAAFPGTTGPRGVDRVALGAKVFTDTHALTRLEALVHPALRRRLDQFVADHSRDPILVLDLPLLFERPGLYPVDATIVVTASAEVQRARVLNRPGMTEEKFEAILARQLPDAVKRARADFLIDNSGSLAQTRAQLVAVLAQLSQRMVKA